MSSEVGWQTSFKSTELLTYVNRRKLLEKQDSFSLRFTQGKREKCPQGNKITFPLSPNSSYYELLS
jgi:hypothetical protein